ncbi:unnamed protein product [Meganyctiphanes norvegica]|uniref:Uncharacterized protein n=1 Tax=Meganyctiphanes norvegica TaxID=48144 RepID=A0AAV2RQL9_MEGNR
MGALATVSTSLLFSTIFIGNSGSGTNVTDSATGLKMLTAASRGELVKVRKLTSERCTGVNFQAGEQMWTPLHFAARRNDLEVALLLLSCKADPNIEATGGWRPLAVASKYADGAMIHAILAANPEIDAQDDSGFTALIYTSKYDNLDTAHVLIREGAQLNLQTNKTIVHKHGEGSGWTALMYASRFSHLNITNMLLEHGADMNIQDTDGNTALHIATEENRKEQVNTLMQHGTDLRIRSKSGETAGDIARNKGFLDILQLIEHFTEIDHTNNQSLVDTNNKSLLVTNNSILVISLVAIIIILVISIIGGYLYFVRYKGQMQHSLQSDPWIFKNEEKEESIYSYQF